MFLCSKSIGVRVNTKRAEVWSAYWPSFTTTRCFMWLGLEVFRRGGARPTDEELADLLG